MMLREKPRVLELKNKILIYLFITIKILKINFKIETNIFVFIKLQTKCSTPFKFFPFNMILLRIVEYGILILGYRNAHGVVKKFKSLI